MSINWTIYPATLECYEFQESKIGRIEHDSTHGWNAWLYLPSGHYKVGECYPSAQSAKNAVIRAYKKHMPLNF